MSNVILSIGALVIFGTFLTSSNRLMTANTMLAEQNEYYISAVSLAQSVIDEAKTKAFDERTVGNHVYTMDSLTMVSALGPDVSEGFRNTDTLSTVAPYSPAAPGFYSNYVYNDIDDYNYYHRLVNTPRAEGYSVMVTVKYVNEADPDAVLAVQTFCKRMTVSVASPYMPYTVKLSYLFTY